MNHFKSNSQAGQDAFAYYALSCPKIGSFLDIGCSHPVTINNTYALEQAGMLYGLSIDINDHSDLFKQHRKTKFVQGDATTMDWEKVLTDAGMPPLIDYLSLDVDENNVEVLRRFPLQKYRFRVVTCEHDSYRVGTAFRDEMRKILSSNGYVMVAEDVMHEGLPFEDWWIEPNRVLFRGFYKSVEGEKLSASLVPKRTLNDYFDKIICINLSRRWDRWKLVQHECAKHNFHVDRFEGHDLPNDGNRGCTASHRGVLELIAHNRWPRVLVLEDDFEIIRENFIDLFEEYWKQVPADWDIVYLGGHYAEKPQYRVSQNIIRINGMKTTSSYVVTCGFARYLAPYIDNGPIDELFSKFLTKNNSYIFSPRLIVQRESFSDLQNHVCNNTDCMMDESHEKMV